MMDTAGSSNKNTNDHSDNLHDNTSKQTTTSSIDDAIANLSATTLDDSSLHGTFDHLLPRQEQQHPTWSNTYSIPLFSSFGNPLGMYVGTDNMAGGEFSSSEHSNLIAAPFGSSFGLVGNYQSQSDKVSSDGGLFRPIQSSNNSDRNTFSASIFKANNEDLARLTSQSDYQQQRNHINFNPTPAPTTRSYSSVLHAHSGAGKFSIFQRQQNQSSLDGGNVDVLNIFNVAPHDRRQATTSSMGNLNPDQSGLLFQHSTNQRQSGGSLQYNQQEQQMHNHQQARHLSEYISSINQQHYRPTGAMLNGRFGTIGGILEHRHQQFGQQESGHAQRSTAPQNLHSRNQASKPFPIGASSLTRRKNNRLPFFQGTSGGSCANTGTGAGAPAGSVSSSQNPLRLDVYGSAILNQDSEERFSRKVFVGGLPPDIDEEEIKASFRRFGSLIVDWPHKAESKSYFPPKGYAFLLFQEESSVQALIDTCMQEDDKLYLCVSSPTIKDKPVQIRPWRLSDSDFVLDATLALDPRKTVFVGGVPRPLKASELATIMNNLYSNVCYAGIDTDPDLKYPKGAGRVAFSNHQSYIAAISARFVQIHHSEIEKRVEVKPYVLDDQFCDECNGARCNNKFAPFFCANITCLRYYCDNCWSTVHSQVGREFHKPLVKEGSERPRLGPGGANGGANSRSHDNTPSASAGASSSDASRHSATASEPMVRIQQQSFRWQ